MKFAYRSGKSILGITLVFLLSMAACKKSTEGPKNNPVDVENCVLQSDVDYSGVVWGLSGCNRVWYNVDANGNNMPETYYYKFKSPNYLANNSDSDMLEMVIYMPNMPEGGRNAFGRYRVTQASDGPVMQTMSFNFSILSKSKVKLKSKTECSIEIVEGAIMGSAAGTTQNMKVYFGDLPDDFNVMPNTGGGGGGACSSACGNSYSGPDIDIQIDSHCMQAYDLVCNQGKSCSSAEVQQVCNTFRGMVDCCKPNSIGTYPNCPYCD